MVYYSSELKVIVDGVPLLPMVSSKMARATVDMSVFLPDQFELVFADESQMSIVEGGFVIGSFVEVNVVGDEGMPVPLMLGEVTSLELDFDGSRVNTVVRGLDRSHHMMRGRKTRQFPFMMASEIVTMIVAEHEIIPEIIWPETPFYENIVQPGITDWQFVQYLARLCGCLAYVHNDLFHFEPPPPAEEGPLPGNLLSVDPRVLTLGKNLRRVKAVMRSAEQVGTVEVRGYDSTFGTPVVGVGMPVTTASELVVQPEEVAMLVGEANFGGAYSRPVPNEEEAEMRAEALASQIAGAYAEIEGECQGNPYLSAGTSVGLRSVGEPFVGNYTLTSACHVWDRHTGYSTQFSASGSQDRTLFGLANGQVNPMPEPMPSVSTGIVVNVDDPEEQGRVQLMFPWLSDTYVSDWVRVAQPHTGIGSGCLFLPDVDSEVVVAFQQGDLSMPIVVGSLYNTIHEPVAPGYAQVGVIAQRRIMSSERNAVTLFDGEEISGVQIATGDELQSILLSMTEATIIINSEGTIEINGAAIEINAEGDLSLSAEGAIEISAGADISIEAGGAVELEAGADVNLASGGAFNIEAGAEASVAAGANFSIEAPMVEVL